jgi:hypothetical protein
MTGNSFTNWGKLTPRHNAFVQAILQNPVHIIATIRSKQDYVLSERNGKQVPEKIGLKGVTRDGMDYECTIVFDIDIKHNAVASKDRTGLFMDKPEFKITPAIGAQILTWCQQGVSKSPEDIIVEQINLCKTYDELKTLYINNPSFQASLGDIFSKRKAELLPRPTLLETLKAKHSANGNITH